MFTRYRGGGIGHKSTREVSERLLAKDRESMVHYEMENEEAEEIDEPLAVQEAVDEDMSGEEEDYGYNMSGLADLGVQEGVEGAEGAEEHWQDEDENLDAEDGDGAEYDEH